MVQLCKSVVLVTKEEWRKGYCCTCEHTAMVEMQKFRIKKPKLKKVRREISRRHDVIRQQHNVPKYNFSRIFEVCKIKEKPLSRNIYKYI